MQISFLGPLESVSKIHRFLVQVLICSDPAIANWKSADVRVFKIRTKFGGEEVRPEEKDIRESSFMKESVYGDAEELKEEISSLDEREKIITSKNSESSNIQLIPSDFIRFKGTSINEASYLTIKNNTPADICFKIMTSSPKEFLVMPNSNIVTGNSEASVQISFLGPLESVSKIHRFLVQVLICSDPAIANWKSADVRVFKIRTKFGGEEVRPEEKDIRESSFMKESVYGDAEELKEEISSLDEREKIITSKNS